MNQNRPPVTLLVLTGIVALEALALGVATIWLLVELVVDTPASMATALALTVTCAILAVGVAWLAVGLARRKPTVRGAVLVWQVLQGAVGLGALQGVFAREDIGWAMLLPAIAGIVLVLMPSVSAALGHRREADPEA